jgi:dihydrofolate reductase
MWWSNDVLNSETASIITFLNRIDEFALNASFWVHAIKPSQACMSSFPLTLIVACTSKNGIGKDGKLPWRLSKEMKYFLKVTTAAPSGQRNAVIMGRNTWESIPPKFRPLKNRLNIVVTSRSLDGQPYGSCWKAFAGWSSYRLDTHRVDSLSSAVKLLSTLSDPPIHHAFVIGGAQLYTSALELPATNRILLTRLKEPDFECDTFFPSFEEQGWTQAPFQDLVEWAGLDSEAVKEEETEGQANWQYQMWTRG